MLVFCLTIVQVWLVICGHLLRWHTGNIISYSTFETRARRPILRILTGPELKMNKTQYSIAGDPHFEMLPFKELLFMALRNILELAFVCVSEMKVFVHKENLNVELFPY